MILLLITSAIGMVLFVISLIFKLPSIIKNIALLLLGVVMVAVEIVVYILRGISFILMHTIFLPYHLKNIKQDLRVYRKNKLFTRNGQWQKEIDFQQQLDVLYLRTKYAYPDLPQKIYDEYRNELLDAFDTTRDEKELNKLHEIALMKVKKVFYNL